MTAYPKFLRAVRRLPLPGGARVRLAVSGGPDSMALVGLFLALRERQPRDLELSLGHVHHGLRGADADADERFCREFAEQHSLPFVSEWISVPKHARATHLSLETAARELRFQVFARWAKMDNLTAIATGHTADDQVETVLGNLLRGTGIAGLRGMRPLRRLREDGGAWLWRPLLEIPSSALERFRTEAAIPARVDRSNLDPRPRRNRIRGRLVPLLTEEFNPALGRAILGLAEEADHVDRFRRSLTRPLTKGVREGPEAIALPREPLLRVRPREVLLPPLLDALWQRATGRSTGLNRDQHDAWYRLASGNGPGVRYALSGGWRIERTARWMLLWRPLPRAPVATIPAGVGTTRADWAGVTLAVSPGTPQGLAEVPLDPKWLGGDAVVRAARREDRIAIAGGHARVEEVLRARGLPREFRQRYPVWVVHGEVVWVPGMRVAQHVVDHADEAQTGAVFRGAFGTEPERSQEAFVVAMVLDRVSCRELEGPRPEGVNSEGGDPG